MVEPESSIWVSNCNVLGKFLHFRMIKYKYFQSTETETQKYPDSNNCKRTLKDWMFHKHMERAISDSPGSGSNVNDMVDIIVADAYYLALGFQLSNMSTWLQPHLSVFPRVYYPSKSEKYEAECWYLSVLL